jgi:hypothetical protein
MWDPRHLTTLEASSACYEDWFTLLVLLLLLLLLLLAPFVGLGLFLITMYTYKASELIRGCGDVRNSSGIGQSEVWTPYGQWYSYRHRGFVIKKCFIECLRYKVVSLNYDQVISYAWAQMPKTWFTLYLPGIFLEHNLEMWYYLKDNHCGPSFRLILIASTLFAEVTDCLELFKNN